MIDVASLVVRNHRARCRLCAGCTDSGPAATQSAASRSSLNTRQTGHSREQQQHVGQTATSNKDVTKSCQVATTHFDHMFPCLTAELVCEYVTKEMWKTGQLFVVGRVCPSFE